MPTRSRTCPSAGRAEYCLTLLHVFLLAALLAGCDILGDDASSDDKAFDAAFEQQLESTVNTLFESLEVPGALVGVWIPEKGSWTTSLGVANLETGEPSAFENHVRIGSITKTFTVTMILQLAEQGSLDLEDPISNYFDTDPASGKITLSHAVPHADEITLRSLANMTSGLASYTFDPVFQEQLFTDPARSWNAVDLVDIGIENTIAGCPHTIEAGWPACYEPGTDWNYSNTNTVMLGLVVEHITGKAYGEVLQDRILRPLGMSNTFHPTNAAMPEPYAHGYTGQGVETGMQEATLWNPTWGFAVGDLISSFEDLRLWGRALGRGTLLSSETQADRMTEVTVGLNQPGVMAYGLGIVNTRGWWGHTGELPGYNSLTYYHPGLDAVMVVIVNKDDEGPAPLIASALIDLIDEQGW